MNETVYGNLQGNQVSITGGATLKDAITGTCTFSSSHKKNVLQKCTPGHNVMLDKHHATEIYLQFKLRKLQRNL